MQEFAVIQPGSEPERADALAPLCAQLVAPWFERDWRARSLRIWVSGCGEGADVCAIAIALMQSCAERGCHIPFKVFGTDRSVAALQRARAGVYPPERVRALGPAARAYRERGYEVLRSVRNHFVFAQHVLGHPPPFPHLELILCREPLGTLQPAAREAACDALHFALEPGGVLWLESDSPRPPLGRFGLTTSGAALHRGLAADGAPEARALAPAAAQELARELAELRSRWHSLRKAQEATADDLRARNAQLQASNERLQAATEELQAMQEELEATNEQLGAVNEELCARVAELDCLADDLSNVFSSVSMPIAILDRELCVRRLTPAAQQSFSLDAAAVGRPLGALSQLNTPDLQGLLRRALESGVPHERAVRDRAGRALVLRVHPNRTRAGRVDGLLLELVDVQEIAAAREFAEAVIAAVPRPLLVLDAELRVRSANPEFCRVFRLPPEALCGRPLLEVGGGAWRIGGLEARLRALCELGRAFENAELEHVFAELGPRSLCASGRRIEGAVAGEKALLLAVDDVTAQRAAERALRDADARRNEFLAMLAHELRNPLAAVVSAAELARGEPLCSGVDGHGPLGIIARQAAHMKRMLDDLLDVSRITRGRIELQRERLDLRAAVRASAAALGPLVRERRHALALQLPDEPLWIHADPARIEQVIGNLLSNAAKYTPPGGQLAVAAQPLAGRVQLRVRDSGVGIPAAQLPRVFELFAQGDATLDRSQGGLGIGLTVVKTLIELHGGTVEARSAGVGQGSEFCISLPLAQPAAVRAPAGPGAARRSAHGRRVLLVEDHAEVAQALAQLLTRWGYSVRTAADGPSALQLRLSLQPEILLLDLGLPGMSGYELAQHLRAQRGVVPARLVALTGYGQRESRERAVQCGIDVYLVKPVEPSELRELLERESAALQVCGTARAARARGCQPRAVRGGRMDGEGTADQR